MAHDANQHPHRPEARPGTREGDGHVNKGRLIFREQHPFDPLKDRATAQLTHKGGIGDARTEHY